METAPVICNQCGASLEVPEGARFVTCRYCQSQLEIKRTASTITTEVLARLDQRTAAMAEDLQAIRRESEIERLDREWQQKESHLLVKDKDGHTSRPSATAGIIGAVVMGIFGLIWTVIAFSMASSFRSQTISMPGMPVEVHSSGPGGAISGIMPCFGVVFILGAIVMGVRSVMSAGKYEEEHRRYQARRQALLDREAGER